MDKVKCHALKERLAAQPEPQVVPIEQFFDGNDDLGSIGCNLDSHPGIDTFRDVLAGLLAHPDVEAVYAQISELDPGDECWPFADTVLVAGTIPVDELAHAVRFLLPDEVKDAKTSWLGVPPALGELHQSPVLSIWWD